MQCHEFENRLNAVLDERNEPEADPRLTAHARDCPPCRQLLAGQRALFTGLRQSIAPPLKARFAQQVVARAGTPQPASISPAPRRVWLAVGALLASAAAALLAVSLLWYARRGGPDVAPDSSGQSSSVVTDSPSEKQRGGSQQGRNVGSFALAQPGWIIEAPRLPDHVQTSIDHLPETLPATIERINQVERVAPGMRPIWRSFAFLWDALRHALPGARSEEPPPRNRTSASWLERLQLA
jgi:hypothetical protein